ncbi:Helix-turn-helix domain-containing protein [Micromonospora phaseoli]|uniref:Helix-turn-helix domain-containing protein n=1 Tax=Micromonospora phaseoli TaxID=1144548 RepID=A0A1H7DR77_9ACTN|nr:helix-turn-helix transcriptional regulator [Micromonospora phaseoli]PZV89966.1 helix-turn-helix protein [Micromonospora phaseoli]GIJ78821.1 hypothetical protein Xph01_32530 [Micromonospora phaseoli]SEK04256.1 Helix-turn-helix domain-containing protein [Micromonospora phaseoli]
MAQQLSFGQRLKALRLEMGLSQAALAGDGMSTGYLSRLESGARRPTKHAVDYLSERLGVPLDAEPTPAPSPSALAHVLAAVQSAPDSLDLSDVLAEALRADAAADPALRWQGLWQLARMRSAQQRLDEQFELLVELNVLSEEIGHPGLWARACTALARCVAVRGDVAQSLEYASRAYLLAEDLPVADRAAALLAIILAQAELGQLVEAREHADELCELTREAAGVLHVEALWASATVRTRQADYAMASQLLEQALVHLSDAVDVLLWARLRLGAASLYLQTMPPRTDLAQLRLDEVHPIIRLVGTDLYRQQLSTLCAQLAFEEGRIDEARELCDEVDGQPVLLAFRDRIRQQTLHGLLMILAGEREAGIRHIEGLAQEAQDTRNVELAATVWRSLAKVLSQAPGPGADRAQHRTGSAARAYFISPPSVLPT